ncbi:MAG: DUF1059 domain-containing protein [Nitrospirae bacterium]|nr:DUF1059 domain-containing protein [Nitrospirota bacterium]
MGTFGCLDVNPTGGCAFEVQAETDDEVLRLAGDHVKNMHRVTSMPPDMVSKGQSRDQDRTRERVVGTRYLSRGLHTRAPFSFGDPTGGTPLGVRLVICDFSML